MSLQERVVEIMEEDGAILYIHVRLNSGLDSDRYFDCAQISPHTKHVDEIGIALSEHFQGANVEAVVTPATDGIPFGAAVASFLTALTGRDVLSFYAKKVDGSQEFFFEPDYHRKLAGLRVLVIDDMLTTGGSVKRVMRALPQDAKPVGVGVIADRSGGKVTKESLGVPDLYPLAVLEDISTYKDGECPMCLRDEPLDQDHGHPHAPAAT